MSYKSKVFSLSVALLSLGGLVQAESPQGHIPEGACPSSTTLSDVIQHLNGG